jgi:hypothetical protein
MRKGWPSPIGISNKQMPRNGIKTQGIGSSCALVCGQLDFAPFDLVAEKLKPVRDVHDAGLFRMQTDTVHTSIVTPAMIRFLRPVLSIAATNFGSSQDECCVVRGQPGLRLALRTRGCLAPC